MHTNFKMLMVDDYEPTNLLHKEYIKSLFPDIEVQTFTDPFEALEVLQGKNEENKFIPNVICLDINMPAMSGWEFLEAYKLIPNIQAANINIYMLSTFE